MAKAAQVSPKPPTVKSEFQVINGNLKNGQPDVVFQGNLYTGTHSDGTAIAKRHGVMWWKVQGPNAQGYKYIDISQPAYDIF